MWTAPDLEKGGGGVPHSGAVKLERMKERNSQRLDTKRGVLQRTSRTPQNERVKNRQEVEQSQQRESHPQRPGR